MTVGIAATDEWVRHLIPEALPTENPVVSSVSGEIALSKIDVNVALTGQLSLHLKPACDRCSEPFVMPLSASFSLNLIPRREFLTEMRTKGGRDIELHPEDLEFGFYDEDEIDLGRIVAEQLVLAMPVRFICRDDCRGLCPRCGTNLNEGTCACTKEEVASFRLEALKSFKPKK